jgi:hypothetical protein
MRLRSAAGAGPVIRRVLAGWRRDSSINRATVSGSSREGAVWMSYAASEFWREAFAVAVVARYDFSADLAAECIVGACGHGEELE